MEGIGNGDDDEKSSLSLSPDVFSELDSNGGLFPLLQSLLPELIFKML